MALAGGSTTAEEGAGVAAGFTTAEEGFATAEEGEGGLACAMAVR